MKTTLETIFDQGAQYLDPVLFRSGKLVVFVKAPVWATHIRHRQSSIMAEFEALGLHITELRVKVTPPRSSSDRSKQKPKVPSRAGSNSLHSISNTSQSVTNPKLQAALSRLQERLDKRR